MKKHILSSLILVGKLVAVLSLSSTAHAVLGPEHLRAYGGSTSTCRITSRDAQGTLLNICSGSLIKSNKVLTAAHCSGPNTQVVYVECGFIGYHPAQLTMERTIKGTPVLIGGVFFDEWSVGRFTLIDKEHDQAIISLPTSFKTQPMPSISNFQIQSTDICRIEGYGRTNDGTAGILYSGQLPAIGPRLGHEELADAARVLIRKMPGQQSAFKDIYTMPETSFVTNGMRAVVGRRGDSGGPIICQRGLEKYVVAVWAQILIEAPKAPPPENRDPQNYELVLHISHSRLIRTETQNHAFGN